MKYDDIYRSPDELQISESEYDALLKTKKLLEEGEVSIRMEDSLLFDKECGTVACIGGWMYVFMNSKNYNSSPTKYGYDEFANGYVVNSKYRTENKLYNLFFPLEQYNRTLMRTITNQQAIKAIENFLILGEPKWECVLNEEQLLLKFGVEDDVDS